MRAGNLLYADPRERERGKWGAEHMSYAIQEMVCGLVWMMGKQPDRQSCI